MRGELGWREQRGLDLETRQFQAARQVMTPARGWLRTVRKTLGMSAVAMAEDLDVTPSMVFQLERSEWKGTITLKRLKRVAWAMECQLVYCIVPMSGSFEDQALEYVKKIIRQRQIRRRR